MIMTLEELWQGLTGLLPSFITALPVALVIILGGILINLLFGRALTLLAKRTDLTDADVLPARNMFRWLVRIIVFVLVLSVFGFELGGIWALVSTVLAMIAIGFVAVWSLLSHSTATILLVIIRPFQIGDDIALPSQNMAGRVIDLNFFFTTLLDHEGNEWRVPNNMFFQKVMKRTKQPASTALSAQLNNPVPATVTPPPAPTEDDPIRS